MSEWQIAEEDLLRVNTYLQRSDDVLVNNCVTRTAQESKLFPIVPYVMLAMIESYWRYPDQLRAISERISPEDLGHRARNTSTLLSKLTSWGTANYYLNGRGMLNRLGLIRPEDNLEDLVTVVDWHQRFTHSYNRVNGHAYSYDAGEMAQHLEERVLQVFEADCFEADDELREAATRFNAIATQYNFLVHCESRSGLNGGGPYRLGGRRLLHTRDFFNMSECTLPWMDGIGAAVSYNDLTLVLITDGVSFEITDWASVYTMPEAYQGQILGVGLYTSDYLTDRYIPVGMDNRVTLVETLDGLTEQIKEATRELYRRFAEMKMDQMLEAGVITYYQAPVDAAKMAGIFKQDEWDTVDQRTRRLWDIHNEEYALDGYIDHFTTQHGQLTAQSEYYLHPIGYRLWKNGGGKDELPAGGRTRDLVPARVLRDDDYPRRVNPNGFSDVEGDRLVAGKEGGYRTSAGTLTEAEVNERAEAYGSPLLKSPWREMDEPTIKDDHSSEDADALYRYIQERSRLLKNGGAGLLRSDIDRIRADAGERTWEEVARSAAAVSA